MSQNSSAGTYWIFGDAIARFDKMDRYMLVGTTAVYKLGISDNLNIYDFPTSLPTFNNAHNQLF